MKNPVGRPPGRDHNKMVSVRLNQKILLWLKTQGNTSKTIRGLIEKEMEK